MLSFVRTSVVFLPAALLFLINMIITNNITIKAIGIMTLSIIGVLSWSEINLMH